MNQKNFLGVAAVGLVVLVFAVEGNAECCHGDFGIHCADCSTANPYCGAFGEGGCNIFGCNCGGGCRKRNPYSFHGCEKRRTDRSIKLKPDAWVPPNEDGAVTGKEIVRTFDADGDRALNAVEVFVFLKRSGVAYGVDQWRTLDTNLDGKLDASEIDNDHRGDDGGVAKNNEA